MVTIKGLWLCILMLSTTWHGAGTPKTPILTSVFEDLALAQALPTLTSCDLFEYLQNDRHRGYKHCTRHTGTHRTLPKYSDRNTGCTCAFCALPDSLVAYSSQCKALPKQVSAIIRQIERHLRNMEDLLHQDQEYLLDPLVQDTIKEFQLCANCWLP